MNYIVRPARCLDCIPLIFITPKAGGGGSRGGSLGGEERFGRLEAGGSGGQGHFSGHEGRAEYHGSGAVIESAGVTRRQFLARYVAVDHAHNLGRAVNRELNLCIGAVYATPFAIHSLHAYVLKVAAVGLPVTIIGNMPMRWS